MSELVTVGIKDYVADVRLNRAEKMNALSIPMFEEITRVGKELAHNKEIRAIVLSGEGRGFCAGLDLANFTDADLVQIHLGPGAVVSTPIFFSFRDMYGRKCQSL